jgi:hypothetical protein
MGQYLAGFPILLPGHSSRLELLNQLVRQPLRKIGRIIHIPSLVFFWC